MKFFTQKVASVVSNVACGAVVGGAMLLTEMEARRQEQKLQEANPNCSVRRKYEYYPGVGGGTQLEVTPKRTSTTNLSPR